MLLDRKGRCKLADFGVSTAVRESTFKQNGGQSSTQQNKTGGMFAGTVYYTAPEVLSSKVRVGCLMVMIVGWSRQFEFLVTFLMYCLFFVFPSAAKEQNRFKSTLTQR